MNSFRSPCRPSPGAGAGLSCVNMVLEGQQVSLISTVSGLTMGSTSINFSNIDQKELGSLVSQPARQSSNRWMEIQYPSEFRSDHAHAQAQLFWTYRSEASLAFNTSEPVTWSL
eukprot:TRINITY_DN7163_c0_g1_i7.p1 TRINITY_DN7163_c0_g1~~TRINITY_DN7163_c0_g1_i7.p1  ORF type:complete len:114 (-),score=14.60 TRINITY_DN7163_c0_g1_i7:378-719(-)